MYENVTYEDILQRMLNRISNTMDKREGSIAYDTCATVAVEVMNMFIEMGIIKEDAYADTASLPYLVERAKERGISQKLATNAVLKVVSTPTTVEIPIGSRFSLNTLNYSVTEKIADGEYQVTCETTGIEGNQYFGNLIPIDYITGLETIEVSEVLIPGEDDEDAESLRTRYFQSLNSQAFGGNITDYKEKTLAISGVGGVKVTPVWNGGGTVKLTILDSEFNQASDILVDSVQQTIDPTKDGSGVGIAPIGHIVTVDTVSEIDVTISSTYTFDTGYTFEGLTSQINSVIEDYFLELRKAWSNEKNLVVRIAQIDSRILGIQGILDVSGTTLNGNDSNIILDTYEVPTLESVISNA